MRAGTDNKREAMKKSWLLCLAAMLASGLWAEDKKLAPVFPAEFPDLIYVEGESAVSTNFNQEATLDYGSSGYRVLQLNKGPDAPGAPFFAEYVFSVEDEGDYQLWIGGTPVGNKNPLAPSYASPVQFLLDGAPAVPVYREDVNVVEQYSLTNYWARAKALVHLTKGSHTVRFEVNERRRYDNKYYFFLDAFFFLKDGTNPPADLVPTSFPKDRANRSIDNYYLSIDQYDYTLQTQPKVLSSYIELSHIYSMVGDYQNALKTLARARVNVGDDSQITLLMAKNQVWSGNWSEGLELYRTYLKAVPKDLAVWSELAKILAWQGQYAASLDTYRQALKNFPDDLNLSVNYGLTYLWANRIKEGEAQLNLAWASAEKDSGKLADLGQICLVNGYPAKSTDTYEKAIGLYPASLNFYLLMEDGWLRQARKDKADEVAQKISDTFQPSDRLSALLQQFQTKATLKDQAIASYEAQLKLHPDEVKLRQELIQAYYWNGAKDKAVAETRHILVNKLFDQFSSLDKELEPTYQVLDELYLARKQLNDVATRVPDTSKALKAALDQWTAASTSKTQDGLAAAQATLAQTLDATETFYAGVLKNSDFSRGLADQAAPEAKKLDDDQKTLQGYLPWTWNRQAEMDELTLASSEGLALADFLLARLALDDQNPVAASVPLARLAVVKDPLPPYQTLQLQGQLWSLSKVDPEALKAGPYFSYGTDLSQAVQNLQTAPSVTRDFSDRTPAQAAELLKTLEALAPALQTQTSSLVSLQNQLHRRLLTRLQVQFYRYDLDTLELRYQLGSFYLDLDNYNEARVQLDRALLISPENVYIQFDLGRARQLSGDWSGAMDLYRSIYQTNPKFEFTASSYNQLAKIHEDQFSSQVTSFVDNARDSTQAVMNYHFSGNSLLSVDASYTLDNIRIYEQSSTVVPGSINLQTALMKPRVSLGALNLSVYGKAGAAFQDTLLGASVASNVSVQPTDPFLQYLGFSPVLGAGATWSSGPATWDASYTFDQIKDTFLAGQTASFEHLGETTLTLYFGFPTNPFVQAVSSRSYLKAASVFSPSSSATNTLYSALEEVAGVANLTPQPATNLTLLATASWDNSGNPTETEYYSPNNVSIFKGGAQVDSTFVLGGNWNLGVVGRVAAGTYSNATSQSLLTEGGATARLSTGDLAISLDLATSVTTTSGTVLYWSDQARLNVTVGLPSYLLR